METKMKRHATHTGTVACKYLGETTREERRLYETTHHWVTENGEKYRKHDGSRPSEDRMRVIVCAARLDIGTVRPIPGVRLPA